MKRLLFALLFFSSVAYGQNCARRDDYLSTAMGQAIAGANVYYYLQPGIGQAPASTIASTFSDGACSVPSSQPPIPTGVNTQTNGFGQATAYMAPGVYTIVFQSPYIQTKNLPDQAVGSGGSGTVTSVTCSNLDPLFTCSVASSFSTPNVNFVQEQVAGNTVFGNPTGTNALPSFSKLVTGQAGANVQGNGSLFQLSAGVVTPFDCVEFDANGNTIDAGAGCGAGSISGLTAGAVVTGLTSTSIQTPSATSTLDGSGNFQTNGFVGSGFGASTAGFLGLSQGTAQGLGTTQIGLTAPTSVTSYNILFPAAAGTGIMHFANSANVVTATFEPNYKTCAIIVGSDDAGSALANTNLGPQGRLCFIPSGSTVVEIDVAADAGTPNVIPAKNHAGSASALVSGALATAASGGIACSNTGGTTGLDGVTTCSGTLQNTTLAAGDYLQLTSGTAGGTAKRMSIFITWSVN